MRKFRSWPFLAAIGLFMFAVTGCSGSGGSLEPSDPAEQEITIPNDYPDTYDTERVLEGTWRTVDENYEASSTYFRFVLNSASLTFTSTDIEGTVAQSSITSRQEWYTSLISGDVEIDLGINSLGLNFDGETGTMIHQGKDSWRCNVDGNSKTAMNIKVLSETLITVGFKGTTGSIYNGIGTLYDFTLTFRKEQYAR
ncbi:MAG: hypothetical protein IJR63_03640 [Synergistaceae bacterium]|nr:hypothetical protein [Synergistaceae bacterium]